MDRCNSHLQRLVTCVDEKVTTVKQESSGKPILLLTFLGLSNALSAINRLLEFKLDKNASEKPKHERHDRLLQVSCTHIVQQLGRWYIIPNQQKLL